MFINSLNEICYPDRSISESEDTILCRLPSIPLSATARHITKITSKPFTMLSIFCVLFFQQCVH